MIKMTDSGGSTVKRVQMENPETKCVLTDPNDWTTDNDQKQHLIWSSVCPKTNNNYYDSSYLTDVDVSQSELHAYIY